MVVLIELTPVAINNNKILKVNNLKKLSQALDSRIINHFFPQMTYIKPKQNEWENIHS